MHVLCAERLVSPYRDRLLNLFYRLAYAKYEMGNVYSVGHKLVPWCISRLMVNKRLQLKKCVTGSTKRSQRPKMFLYVIVSVTQSASFAQVRRKTILQLLTISTQV